jgi:hypothetical protein
LALLHSFKQSNFNNFSTQLNVILTHVDKDPNASGLVMWAQSYMVNDLRNEFKGIVDISTKIHAINAQCQKDVQHVLDFVLENCYPRPRLCL